MPILACPVLHPMTRARTEVMLDHKGIDLMPRAYDRYCFENFNICASVTEQTIVEEQKPLRSYFA